MSEIRETRWAEIKPTLPKCQCVDYPDYPKEGKGIPCPNDAKYKREPWCPSGDSRFFCERHMQEHYRGEEIKEA